MTKMPFIINLTNSTRMLTSISNNPTHPCLMTGRHQITAAAAVVGNLILLSSPVPISFSFKCVVPLFRPWPRGGWRPRLKEEGPATMLDMAQDEVWATAQEARMAAGGDGRGWKWLKSVSVAGNVGFALEVWGTRKESGGNLGSGDYANKSKLLTHGRACNLASNIKSTRCKMIIIEVKSELYFLVFFSLLKSRAIIYA